ncbi:MAG: flavodoxin family protein [Candidatus Electrothrix sp. YB6]
MPNQKIVVLDGTRTDDNFDELLGILLDVLHQKNTDVQLFRLRDIKINHCIGCFNCWLKTPGRCIYNDAGQYILQNIVTSDILILFSPVVFGGYSSELKKIVDRFLPIVLPFFIKAHGETHHPPRYTDFPRIVGIGVTSSPEKDLTHCFRMLVGRNALNLPPSYYSAEVINTADAPEILRQRFYALLSRTDKLPLGKEVASLFSMYCIPADFPDKATEKRRALLITGSPKSNSSSTSSILGEFLLKELNRRGIIVDSLTLKKDLLHNEGQRNLNAAVEKADMILIAFPLYFDTLPFLVTKALEVIASHRENITGEKDKFFLALLNNGLTESYQNAVALAICRNFAVECNMVWAGGLAIGIGEGLINGRSLTGFRGFGGFKRPPLFYVTRSLKLTAAALAAGQPVPEKAMHLMARQPVPFISSDRWRSFVIKKVKKILKKEAEKNGLNIQEMFKKPYAE